MQLPKPQEKQSLDPRDYKVVCVVFGTRYWNDRKYFHAKVCEFIEDQEGEPILFISGAAPSGADNLIIQWCDKFRYPCLKMPADWTNELGRLNFNPKAAGFIRNEEMSQVANNGLCFWDYVSTGTADMLARLESKKIQPRLYRIQTPPAMLRRAEARNLRLPNPED